MEKIDLSSNSKKIQAEYEKVVRGDPSSNYVVYTVDKNSSLTVGETGDGSLEEFIENFEDGSVQFGLARVMVPGSDVSKNLLVGWCPDNAPAKSRLSFANNFATVSNALSGYHVQITARDQDDLDADEFLRRVSAAAGARYSSSSSGTAPPPKPAAAKPVVAKSSAKPSSSSSFVPKTTGKPVAPVTPKPTLPKPASSSSKNDDGWGDEKEIEERDFEKKPLEDVPSAYKPTKVDIAELRKQKSDTISSQPKPFKAQESKSQDADDNEPKSLADRMKSFKDEEPSDGRLTSLPKPKVSHSVASRFTPAKASEGPSFGSKPSFGNSGANDKKDKLVGGLSRNFAAEGGKTPAQLWAEKRGQYKSVSPEAEDEPVKSEPSSIADRIPAVSVNDGDDDEDEDDNEPSLVKPSTGGLPTAPQRNLPPIIPKTEEKEEEEEEEEEGKEEEEKEEAEAEPTIIKPSTGGVPAPPKRNFPPAVTKQDESEEDEDNDKEDDAPAATPSLPARNLPPPPARQTETPKKESSGPSLPARNLPPPPTRQTEPAATPSLPSRSTESKKEGVSAIAEYDYEKDEDNEIEFAEGDLIIEIEFVDEEWWSGKHSKTGDVGLFPASYVSLQSGSHNKSPENADSAAAAAPVESASSAPSVSKEKTPSAIAEYDYEKDEDNEISFAEGDAIVEIEFIDEDWWSGKHSKSGDVGLFPANYVKLDK